MPRQICLALGGKFKKSKRQRRQEKHKGKVKAQGIVPCLPGPESDLIDSQWQMPDNFGELQRSDVTLQPLFEVDVILRVYHSLVGISIS